MGNAAEGGPGKWEKEEREPHIRGCAEWSITQSKCLSALS